MSNTQLRIRIPKGCRPITNPAPGATAGPPRRVENLPSSALGHYPSDPVDAPVAVSAFPIPHSSFPTPHLSLPPTPDPRPPTPAAQRRPAFTLVELLITIAILAILASLVLVAVGAATESAKKQKTETMIATLNGLLMDRYDSYKTRRVPVDVGGLTPAQAADKRLMALRLLMAMEMPDRLEEISLSSFPQEYTDSGLFNNSSEFRGFQSSLNRAYQRRMGSLTNQEFQGAECLYMIITMATGDGEALSYFSDRDIGDTDGDGTKEFLDGWGKPISFIRWPAGFVNESELMTGVADKDHDPFDVLHIQPEAYRLVPLIYSAGPDGDFDVVSTGDGWTPSLDPYQHVTHDGTDVGMRGTPYDDEGDNEENWHDNIHNHLLQRR